jgi:lysophospholipase L1-like esterase
MDLVRKTCFREQPPTPLSTIRRRLTVTVERYPWTIVLAVSMFLVGVSSRIAAQATPATLWTGTWATSPVEVDSHRSFNRQTLRQIVHTSVPGARARIQISNLFGAQPLHIEDVHLAMAGDGSSILPGTDRRILFSGQPFVTIPPGATAASDTVAFAVPALGNVAISMFLPEPTGPPSVHPYAHQTSYVAPGDLSGSRTLPDPEPVTSWYFLTNLDVQGDQSQGSIVTLGASITEGFISADNTNHRWPDDLAQRLASAGLKIGVLNEGIAGNRLLSNGMGRSAETRFYGDVVEQPGVRWVIFSDDPVNDLNSLPAHPIGDQLIGAIARLIARAHEKHIKFLCSTLTPYEGADHWTPEGEAGREQVNAFIRSGKLGCDGVIDQDAATHDPSHPARYLPAYDACDHIHPNEAGLQAIANAVNLTLFSEAIPSAKGPDQ